MEKIIGIIFLGVFAVTAADLQTNQLIIGDTSVDSTVSNGTIVGDKWIVISNTLVQIHVEATPLQGPKSSKDDSKPSLHLMLGNNDEPIPPGHVTGLHGLIYMANNWKTPKLAQKTRVDIFATDDKTKIVLMVRDDGPIYSSTNSGMTWTIINTPGKYDFPLTSGPDGGGFYAEATLHPSPENQTSTNSPPSNWYAIGSASDGSQFAMTGNSSPVLSIKHSGNVVTLSWPTNFTGFTVQQNNDLTTTNWIDVTNSVNVAGEENQVIISPADGNNFYRLTSQSP